jgi:hypothetical protein
MVLGARQDLIKQLTKKNFSLCQELCRIKWEMKALEIQIE